MNKILSKKNGLLINNSSVQALLSIRKIQFIIICLSTILTGSLFAQTQSPSITSFSPTTAATGVTVTISGTNLNNTTAVYFGNTPATSIQNINANTVKAVVGSGNSGNIKLVSTHGTDSLAGFTYCTPLAQSVSIISNRGSNICNGDTVVFTANSINEGNTPVYVWRKNGFIVGSNSTVYSTANLMTGDVVYCTLFSSLSCVSSRSAVSNSIVMNVNQPTASTSYIVLCNGDFPYSWNGQTFNAQGSYIVHLTNIVGCDSAATLSIAIRAASSTVEDVSVCPSSLPYFWKGNQYDSAGFYTINYTNSIGCDSSVSLNLKVNPVDSFVEAVNICPTELPYIWKGVNYNAAGTYNLVFTNRQACDSIITLVLNLKQPSTASVNIAVCRGDLPFSWNGNLYNSTGNYQIHLVNTEGCDSLVTLSLTVLEPSSSLKTDTICSNLLPYNWNGHQYTAGGNYEIHYTNALGCDSIATLNLTVKDTTSAVTIVSICSNELPFSWNGNLYDTAGTYSIHLTNVAGCDSLDILNLIVHPYDINIEAIDICGSALPIVLNGNAYDSAGTYTVQLYNMYGCDSIVILNLYILNASNTFDTITVCSNDLPFMWNGLSLNSSGTYTAHFTNAIGCDSTVNLMLQVLESNTSTQNISICSNELPYIWNGNSYAIAGVYTQHFTNAVGCDSTAFLYLTVLQSSSSTSTVTICSNQLPYSWNGINYNASGNYVQHFTNSVGCDSVATITLNVLSTSNSISNISTCSNELPYIWNGNSYSTAGTYTVHLSNSNGCDSASTLNLSIKQTSTSSTTITICSNDLPYHWNGNSYASAGTYLVHLQNSAACDSAATLILKVKSTSNSNTTIAVCSNALPYNWNGNFYSISGTYTVHFTNAVGCDSAANLLFTVKSTSSSVDTVSVCSNTLPYRWNNVNYSVAGTYTAHFTNAVGCDSTAKLVLKIRTTSTGTSRVTVCNNSLPYVWNGNNYTVSGTYTVHLINSVGCDSTDILILSIKSVTTSTTRITKCSDQMPFVWNNNTFTAAGTYVVHLNNVAGCDSAATLILTVIISPSSLPAAVGPVSACGLAGTGAIVNYTVGFIPGATYLWSTNNANMVIVGGQTTNTMQAIFLSGFARGTVTCKISNPCGTVRRSLNITRGKTARPSNISGPVNPCPYVGSNAGVPVRYFIKRVVNASNYIWEVPVGVTILGGASPYSTTDTFIDVTFPPNFVKDTIKVFAENGCGVSAVRNLLLTTKVPGTPALINGPTDVCDSITANANVTYTVRKVAAAISYDWLIPSDVTIVSTNIHDTAIVLNFPDTFQVGTIGVRSVSSCGTSAYSQLSVSKKFPGTPGQITITNGDVCTSMFTGNATVTYSIPPSTTAPLPTSYIWTLTNVVGGSAEIVGGSNVIGVPTSTSIETVGLSIDIQFHGTFTSAALSVRGNRSCGSGVFPRTLTINNFSPPTPEIPIASADPCINAATSVTYTVSPMTANATVYIWSAPAGTTIDGSNSASPTKDTTTTNSITVFYPAAFVNGNINVKTGSVCGLSDVAVLPVNAINCFYKQTGNELLAKKGSTVDIQSSIELYPNPTNESCTLKIQSKDQTNKAKIQVFNMLNELINEQFAINNNGKFELKIDTRKLVVGVYLIKYSIGVESGTIKMVVQH